MIAVAILAIALHLLAMVSESQRDRVYVRQFRKSRPPSFIAVTNGVVL